MKERPVLFSAPMVRAILDGRKTMTRRVVKEPRVATLYGRSSLDPSRHFADRGFGDGGYLHWGYGGGDFADDQVFTRVYSPYGNVGDRLWVRETWAAPWGRDGDVYYRADGPDRPDDGSWKPSIHMPRWASRITLEITGVRAERLHEISAYDVVSEGVPLAEHKCGCEVCARSSALCTATQSSLMLEWIRLWDSINGKRPGCSWEDNPWVWVIEFRRVEAERKAAE